MNNNSDGGWREIKTVVRLQHCTAPAASLSPVYTTVVVDTICRIQPEMTKRNPAVESQLAAA